MRLREELNRVWVPARIVRPAHLKITPIAKRLEDKFGGAPRQVTPMRNLLEEVERKLTASRGKLTGLERRQRKVIPFLLWTSPQKWSENEKLVTEFLSWVDSDWKAGPRQLWRHYLLNMDPGSLATRRLGTWLKERQERLSPTLQAFSKKWDLYMPNQAISKLASSLLVNGEVIAEIESLKIGKDSLLRSAFLLSVLESVGQQLKSYRQPTIINQTIKSLLAPLGDIPTNKMQGPDDLRQGGLKSIVEGLVLWANKQDQSLIDQTLDLLYQLIGDPRLPQCHGRWNPIDPNVRELVEQWLTKVTIDAFFRFMRELRTDRDDMVQERERFWRGYEKSITRAWLITGRNGEGLAKKLLDKSYGKFASGANVHHDHLGLMFRIGNYIIFEMNKTGATLFWPSGDNSMPGFFLPEYHRSMLISACPHGPESGATLFRLTHSTGWQYKYKNNIFWKTRILPKP